MLNERYLGVDSLCIVQDDTAQKHDQIKNMNIAYGQAFLTIISLSEKGANASSRLPLFSAIELGGRRFFSRPLSPRSLLRQSRYETRAWTYHKVWKIGDDPVSTRGMLTAVAEMTHFVNQGPVSNQAAVRHFHAHASLSVLLTILFSKTLLIYCLQPTAETRLIRNLSIATLTTCFDLSQTMWPIPTCTSIWKNSYTI